jgi:flagellar basal-body rod modification protein FlgD
MNMSTNSVNGTTSTGSTQNTSSSSSTKTSNSSISKDEFLQILASQLSNQDPMNPTSDTEFIGQMAQFSSLEQMQNLNSTFTNTQAYNMVGKDVTATVTASDGSSKTVFGQVSGVVMNGTTPNLEIGSYDVSLSDVTAVYDAGATDATISQASGLIGKTIKGTVFDSSGNSTSVSGTVDSIVVKNTLLYAEVGDKDVPVANITSIS